MKGSLLLFNLKLNCLIFFYQSDQLTDYIHMDIYCKLSKCIRQTLCSYEHYLVFWRFLRTENTDIKTFKVIIGMLVPAANSNINIDLFFLELSKH